jgi:hypothetical protein
MKHSRCKSDKRSLTQKPGIRPGFSNRQSGSVTLVTIGQVAAHATTQCSAQAGTDSGTGFATQAVADHRTTGCANSTTDRSAGAMTFFGGNGTACRASDTSTNRCAGAAAHALANNVTQGAAQTTTDCGSAVASHCTLSNQKAQNHSRQSQTHYENLKNRAKQKGGEIECFRADNVQHAGSTSRLAMVGQHFRERFYYGQKKARWGNGPGVAF